MDRHHRYLFSEKKKKKSILYFSNVESNLSDGPTERVSSFVGTEDTTDFVNFIEKTKVKN